MGKDINEQKCFQTKGQLQTGMLPLWKVKTECKSKGISINQHLYKGLFRYTLLPFGVGYGGPCSWHLWSNSVSRHRFISIETEAEHLHALEVVLKRLASAGLREKINKCKFLSLIR